LDAIFFSAKNITSATVTDTTNMPEKIQQLTDTVRKSLQHMHKDLADAREKINKTKPDSGLAPANFQLGDYVLVAKVTKTFKKNKLQATWFGPLQITAVCTPWIFEVTNLLTHQVSKAHAQRLKFYSDSSLSITEELKHQLRHDGAGYDVESIINYRKHSGQWELEVKWLGFSGEETTWEPLLQLYEDIPHFVRVFLQKTLTEQPTPVAKRQIGHMSKVIKKKYPTFALMDDASLQS
jgi:hypothetical protein